MVEGQGVLEGSERMRKSVAKVEGNRESTGREREGVREPTNVPDFEKDTKFDDERERLR